MTSCLALVGRAKDTIVLLNGENIEPTPIEDAILTLPYIKQVVLVGQDWRSLAVLVVLAEEEEDREAPLKVDPGTLLAEIQEAASRRANVRPWEAITAVEVLDRPFAVEDGTLTQTLKPRKDAIMTREREALARLERLVGPTAGKGRGTGN